MKTIVQDTIERAELLMQRAGDAESWRDLTEEDNDEFISLIRIIEDLGEIKEEGLSSAGITDEETEKLNAYIKWFQDLEDQENRQEEKGDMEKYDMEFFDSLYLDESEDFREKTIECLRYLRNELQNLEIISYFTTLSLFQKTGKQLSKGQEEVLARHYGIYFDHEARAIFKKAFDKIFQGEIASRSKTNA